MRLRTSLLSLLFVILSVSYSFAQTGHALQVDDGSSHYSMIKPTSGALGVTFNLPSVLTNQTFLTQGVGSPTVSNAWLQGGNLNGTGSPDPAIPNYGTFGTLDNVALTFVTNGLANTRMTIAANGDISMNSVAGNATIGRNTNTTTINSQTVNIANNANATVSIGAGGGTTAISIGQGSGGNNFFGSANTATNSFGTFGKNNDFGSLSTGTNNFGTGVAGTNNYGGGSVQNNFGSGNPGGPQANNIGNGNANVTYTNTIGQATFAGATVNTTVGGGAGTYSVGISTSGTGTTTIGVSGNTTAINSSTISTPNIGSAASIANVVILNGGNLNTSTLSVVTGSGTVNTIPKWTPSTTTLGNSLLTDNGSTLSYNGSTINQPTVGSTLTIQTANNPNGATGALTVTTGGVGGGVGSGVSGDLNLNTGGNQTNAAPGTVNISGGPSLGFGTTNHGGHVAINGGSSNNGAGGNITLTSGNGALGGNGGNISLVAGTGTANGTIILTGTSSAQAMNPQVTNTYDLGTTALRWRALKLAASIDNTGDNPLDASNQGIASNGLGWMVNGSGYVANFMNEDNTSGNRDGIQIALANNNGASKAINVTTGTNFNPTGGGGSRTDVFKVLSNGNVNAAGNIATQTFFNFPTTSSSTVGVIQQNGASFIQSFGSNNLFAGTGAGNFTLTAGNSTGIGVNALNHLSTGSLTTAVGYNALPSVSSGFGNTGIGGQALFSATTGGGNTTVGYSSIANVTDGGDNVGIGHDIGAAIIHGSSNTFLGTGSNASGDFSNATAIGANATVTASNTMQLGDGTVTKVNTAGGYFAGATSQLHETDPSTTATYDLGTSSLRWNNLWLAGSLANNADNPIAQDLQGTATGGIRMESNGFGFSGIFSNRSTASGADGIQIAMGTNTGNARALVVTTGANFNPTGGVGARSESFRVMNDGSTTIGGGSNNGGLTVSTGITTLSYATVADAAGTITIPTTSSVIEITSVTAAGDAIAMPAVAAADNGRIIYIHNGGANPTGGAGPVINAGATATFVVSGAAWQRVGP